MFVTSGGEHVAHGAHDGWLAAGRGIFETVGMHRTAVLAQYVYQSKSFRSRNLLEIYPQILDRSCDRWVLEKAIGFSKLKPQRIWPCRCSDPKKFWKFFSFNSNLFHARSYYSFPPRMHGVSSTLMGATHQVENLQLLPNKIPSDLEVVQ
ncbi:hypothetical protein TWF225_004786 [Orbilia oligospora]|nr:hypothetical protein TWF225_004786 [Orbilia oligospora]KAF3260774.1 hypothetical protein TWF128_003396 [Orbilia oligospora]KAF3272719.1 hypothetical protein TWF217_000189 [Orbilia oligospora]